MSTIPVISVIASVFTISWLRRHALHSLALGTQYVEGVRNRAFGQTIKLNLSSIGGFAFAKMIGFHTRLFAVLGFFAANAKSYSVNKLPGKLHVFFANNFATVASLTDDV